MANKKKITTEKLDTTEPIINTKITTETEFKDTTKSITTEFKDTTKSVIEAKTINIVKENVTNTDNKIKPINKPVRYRKIVKRF